MIMPSRSTFINLKSQLIGLFLVLTDFKLLAVIRRHFRKCASERDSHSLNFSSHIFHHAFYPKKSKACFL